MLWTQKDTSGMEIRALGFSPQTSNWCHFWLILYFSLPSEGLLLFISSFQSNNLRDFTILFTYGYSAWGSPQLSCFSDICTALSNSIPDLQEKWVPQTSFSPYTQDLFLLLKNPRPLSPSLPVARQTGCPWQHTWACIHFSSLCVCVLSSNAWPEPKANSCVCCHPMHGQNQRQTPFGRWARKTPPKQPGAEKIWQALQEKTASRERRGGGITLTEEALISRLSLKWCWSQPRCLPNEPFHSCQLHHGVVNVNEWARSSAGIHRRGFDGPSWIYNSRRSVAVMGAWLAMQISLRACGKGPEAGCTAG